MAAGYGNSNSLESEKFHHPYALSLDSSSITRGANEENHLRRNIACGNIAVEDYKASGCTCVCTCSLRKKISRQTVDNKFIVQQNNVTIENEKSSDNSHTNHYFHPYRAYTQLLQHTDDGRTMTRKVPIISPPPSPKAYSPSREEEPHSPLCSPDLQDVCFSFFEEDVLKSAKKVINKSMELQLNCGEKRKLLSNESDMVCNFSPSNKLVKTSFSSSSLSERIEKDIGSSVLSNEKRCSTIVESTPTTETVECEEKDSCEFEVDVNKVGECNDLLHSNTNMYNKTATYIHCGVHMKRDNERSQQTDRGTCNAELKLDNDVDGSSTSTRCMKKVVHAYINESESLICGNIANLAHQNALNDLPIKVTSVEAAQCEGNVADCQNEDSAEMETLITPGAAAAAAGINPLTKNPSHLVNIGVNIMKQSSLLLNSSFIPIGVQVPMAWTGQRTPPCLTAQQQQWHAQLQLRAAQFQQQQQASWLARQQQSRWIIRQPTCVMRPFGPMIVRPPNWVIQPSNWPLQPPK